MYILQPIFLQLRTVERLSRMSAIVLDILRDCPHEGTSEINFAEDPIRDIRGLFRRSLTSYFFGDDTILRWRLSFSIADFCWVRDNRHKLHRSH
jgi:hypothetical protein